MNLHCRTITRKRWLISLPISAGDSIAGSAFSLGHVGNLKGAAVIHFVAAAPGADLRSILGFNAAPQFVAGVVAGPLKQQFFRLMEVRSDCKVGNQSSACTFQSMPGGHLPDD